MTTSTFKYIDPASCANTLAHPTGLNKPWIKVDSSGMSFTQVDHERAVHSMRGHEGSLGVDISGFALLHAPASEKTFTDDAAVRAGYYAEIEQLLRVKLPGVSRVHIFDHTIRRNDGVSARRPVQNVHVDQTPEAAAARVRRHLPDDAAALLEGRFQIINVWRPIAHAASDFPLAVVDYRSTRPEDMIRVDLLYPQRDPDDDGDDRGKEKPAVGLVNDNTDGYEARGETYGVAPSEEHRFWYAKDMIPDEVLFLKCFDSWSEINGGEKGVAAYTPHTAFVDPETPGGTPGRQSIEVRCLVFY